MQKKVAFNVACGTNLLHSHMEIVKQWNIGMIASWFLKPVLLLGVGWRGHASRKTTPYTKLLLRSLLSRVHLHSVRDSYSEGRLRELGFSNVINTACPTMWRLTPEHCADIPTEQGEDVVLTLTDYSPEPQKDRELLDLLKRLYRRVYFWRQGSGDSASIWRRLPGRTKSKSCRRTCRRTTTCWLTVRSPWTTSALGCTVAFALCNNAGR